jgi:hypothetical protein
MKSLVPVTLAAVGLLAGPSADEQIQKRTEQSKF